MRKKHAMPAAALLGSLLLAGGLLSQTPAQQKPYEPMVGQAGKDVVWVPTPEPLVEKMLDMAKVTADDVVMDLGSGEGRIVIAAARRGARAIGVEYNPDLVELSKRNAAAAGVSARASFVHGDIFETDLRQATVITMFLLPSLNVKLRPKLLELPPGTRLVSNSFAMEEWQADERQTFPDCVSWCSALLWIVPAKIEGEWETPRGTMMLAQKFQTFVGTLGPAVITQGKLRGSEISFTMGETNYAGRVEGSLMRLGASDGSGAAWTARRR
jgi:SAM-dependent methyltransferase